MNLAQFKDWSISQESVAKYDDGEFKGECVSLVNQYCYRVLGIPAGVWGHAKDWATNATALTYFSKTSAIQTGDILVYPATNTNSYGHIEIALGGGQALGQNRNLDGKVRVATQLNGYSAILRSKEAGTMNQEEVDKLWKALDSANKRIDIQTDQIDKLYKALNVANVRLDAEEAEQDGDVDLSTLRIVKG